MSRSINILNLGCFKNLVDAQKLATQFHHSGYDVTVDAPLGSHSVVAINTCGFIEKATEESIDTILACVQAKEEKRVDKVFVFGCLAERASQELREALDGVDGIFGKFAQKDLLKTLGATYHDHIYLKRPRQLLGASAFLKIAEGCNRGCSFCSIPAMTGNYHSRTMEDLVQEAKGLIQQGCKELILLAQDLYYYGQDLYHKRKLPQLTKTLADLEGLEWLRLHYLYPETISPDFLQLIAEHPTICRYLDMPLQHVSDKILQAMNRKVNATEQEDLLLQIRETIPEVALRTTFIVGFPNETEKDFDYLCQWVQRMEFDRVGVFTYSHEEGTAAGKTMKDTIPAAVKEERKEHLMALQYGISLRKNEGKIGQTLPVLIEAKEDNFYIGRTEFDSIEVDNEVIVHPPDGHALAPGEFILSAIAGAEAYALYAQPILS